MSVAFSAVLTAAGSGTRLGCDGPKALVNVGGVPIVLRALRGLLQAGAQAVVVTAPADTLQQFQQIVGSVHAAVPVRVVAGGAVRQASVKAGLDALTRLEQWPNLKALPILAHDAARCLTPASLIQRVAAALSADTPAVVPANPVIDTLKRVGGVIGDPLRPVLETPDREQLVAEQTPQGFLPDLLLEAHRRGASLAASPDTAATDDAALVEAMDTTVHVVPGDLLALKVTTKLDWAVAEILAAKEDEASYNG